jgi:hypothetical protein
MEPLTKQRVAASLAEARLAALVAACEPIAVTETGKRQSLAFIRRRLADGPAWRLTFRFGVAATILLMAGGAGAAFGVRRWKGEPSPPGAVALAPEARVPAPLPHPVTRHFARVEVQVPEAMPPEIVRRAPSHAGRARSPSENPALVVAAIQALRQERDAARASRLLAGYLRTYPRGALAEEAIALSIEAADARHSPTARGFAERYLREYPQGRFQLTALRVLTRETTP